MLKGPQGTLFGRNTEGAARSASSRASRAASSGSTRLPALANFGGYDGVVHLDPPRTGDFSFQARRHRQQARWHHREPRAANVTSTPGTSAACVPRRCGSPRTPWPVSYAFDDSYDATTPYHVQLLGGRAAREPLQIAGVTIQEARCLDPRWRAAGERRQRPAPHAGGGLEARRRPAAEVDQRLSRPLEGRTSSTRASSTRSRRSRPAGPSPATASPR